MSTTKLPTGMGRRAYPDRGISFEIPTGWTEIDWGVGDPLGGIKLRAPGGDASIVIEQSGIKHATLREYVDGLLANLATIMPRFKLVSREAALQGGRETERVAFDYWDQVDRSNVHFFIRDDARVLSLYLDTSREASARHRDALELVIASIAPQS